MVATGSSETLAYRRAPIEMSVTLCSFVSQFLVKKLIQFIKERKTASIGKGSQPHYNLAISRKPESSGEVARPHSQLT
jgi:hypothetical protein